MPSSHGLCGKECAKVQKATNAHVAGKPGRMADEEKIGKPWNDDELDAIIADYFSMLDEELSGRSYVKARHSAALMQQIGRTHRSVEFKHQNISAVLDELGMPWIPGYKPKRNYQAAIFEAIGRFLIAHGGFDAGTAAHRCRA